MVSYDRLDLNRRLNPADVRDNSAGITRIPVDSAYDSAGIIHNPATMTANPAY
jgi:hypothetical protein